MAHSINEAAINEMISGCRIHTPYLLDMPPVMLMRQRCTHPGRTHASAPHPAGSAGPANQSDADRVGNKKPRSLTHKGMMALPA
jgi:hypothetical protein